MHDSGQGAGTFDDAYISNFSMTFYTYPTPTYSWASSGTCPGALSSTTIANPMYLPSSPNQYTSCTYTVTVNSGGCTGTASVSVGCPLPVELLDYTGKNTANGNLLKWSTATETNNSYFTIERFADGLSDNASWKIDSKASYGNSSSTIDYSLTDNKDIKPGVYYYKLTQTDRDGTTQEKGTIAISVRAERDILNVKPNPATNQVEVSYDCNSEETALLKMYDRTGSLVMTREITCSKGENKYLLDLRSNPQGIYLITVATSDNMYKARLVKQ